MAFLKIGRSARFYLLGTALVPSAGLAQSATPVPADQQTASEDQSVGAGEIVVTARKRSERLKDIPDSITAFSAAALQSANISNTKDVAVRVPSFSIVETQQPGQPLINIRGVSSVRGGEPPIAVVVDGIQLTDASEITQDLFDVESIEVLKGPQGAVYGRNAIAGAINITTKQPSNDLTGFVQAAYGTGNDVRLSAAAGGAIIADKLLFRIASSYRDFDGDIKSLNAPTSKDANWVQERNFRGNLIAKPSDTVQIDLRYANLYTRGGASYYVNIIPGRDDNAPYPYEGDVPNIATRNLEEASAKVDVDFGAFTLTSVSALTKTRTWIDEDLDYFAADGLTAQQRKKARNLSQEIRLTSTGSGPFKWLAGLYYLNVHQTLTTDIFLGRDYLPLFGLDPSLAPYRFDGSMVRNRNNAYAAFGQISYRFASGLELSGALRYDIDQRRQTDLEAAGQPNYRATFKSLQPKVSVSYFFDNDHMIYANAGKGFRSGGFNPVDTITREFNKEENWNYEAGFKVSLADRRINLSGAAYYTTLKNRQVYIFDILSSSEVIANPIPKARVYGFEAELDARPLPGLELNASIGIVRSKVLSYDTSVFAGRPGADGDYTGNRLPYVAGLSYALSGQYEISLSPDDSITPRFEVNGSGGGYYWELNNRVRRDDLNLVNARLTYRHGPLSLTGFVENLTNQRYVAETAQAEWVGATYDLTAAARGRVWGISGRWNF